MGHRTVNTENILNYLEVWSEHELMGLEHGTDAGNKEPKKKLPANSDKIYGGMQEDEKETCTYGNDNSLDCVDPKEWDKVKKINENHL
jgi:hypothetical protein